MASIKLKRLLLGASIFLILLCSLPLFARFKRQNIAQNHTFRIKNLKEGEIVTSDFQVVVATNWRGAGYTDWELRIDNESLYSTSPHLMPDADGDYLMPMTVHTSDYKTGKHTFTVFDSKGKLADTRTVIFRSPILGLQYDNRIAFQGRSNPVRVTRIRVVLGTVGTWCVEISNLDERIVRKFSGKSDHINVEWDGKNASGRALPEGSYTGKVKAFGKTAALIINR